MSTPVTPQPAAPAASPIISVANTILADLMKGLQPTTQAIVGTIMALNENSSPVQEAADTILALTKAATTIPNPTVQTIAALATGIEAVVAQGVGVVEGANPAPVPVANAHPGFKLWLLHPNIYRQDQKLAATVPASAQSASAPAAPAKP